MKKIEISTSIFPFLWNFIKKYKISLFMAIFVSSITIMSSTIGGQYIFGIIIDKLTNGELNFKSGILYCLLFSFLNFICLIFNIITRKLQFNTSTKIQYDIQNSITEKEIQIALNNFMQNKTVIVIAHRLSTLNIMDRIVVIDKGQIKEDGTKEELLNKENGLFKRMWDTQKEGVIWSK